jgi:hypothetical protein
MFLGLVLVTLTGCGGGGGSDASGSSSSSAPTPPAPLNVVTITVGSGPTTAASNINIPYVTITVCTAGTSSCGAISHVLLDTGSWGLRLMGSALSAAGVTLVDETDGLGNTFGECTPFAAGYASGLIALADVTIGGEVAKGLPVQVIDDSGSNSGPAHALPCSGHSLNTVGAFNANAILGVGVFGHDCGSGCAQVTDNGIYYKCTASLTCSSSMIDVTAQVTNPVILFPDDDNGVIVALPAIAASGAATATGTLTFGIGTQSNNGMGTATVLPVDLGTGRMVVLYGSGRFTDGFIDSGSNSINFADSTIAQCTDNSGFYCPPSTMPLTLTAINQGTNGAESSVSFQVVNFQNVRGGNRNAYAYDDIAGTTAANTFDWGLPFYYGRTIYTAIEGYSTPGGNGPYFAY